jgi:glycosyltransferase involved in cell wall biosynthesis
VSSELADYLAPSFGRRKITVIPNGIDLRQATSARSRAEAKAWLGIDPCVPVICSVARLSRVKRHDLFLQTALHILRDHPHAQFLIAGSGPLQAQISKMVHTFGLNDNVRMMGDRPDIYDVLAACDILLITSDNEGMPMVVLEAMALGTVVVSRGIGGIPEVIGRSSGVLVNSSDPAVLAEACSKVLGDNAWHKRLVQSARETVTQTYTAEVMASQTVQLYERLLGEQRHSG